MQDGSTWGGTGGYADIPGWIAANPAEDLPFTAAFISKDDPYPSGFSDFISAITAFQAAHQGHAFCWDMGQHDVNGIGVIDRDGPAADTSVAYSKASFKLTLPYIATSGSSIDDTPGTGARNGSGVYDGDYVGCVNAGFAWTVSSDTSGAFNFTIDNNFMDRSPTTQAQTTLSGSIASSGSGAVTVADASGFLSVGGGNNVYALVNGTEIIKITSIVGNTINYSSRGQLGTSAGAHSSGETIKQLASQPTGPNGGPYATMTVDVTPRRIQGFTKGKTDGQIPSCNITPFGGSLTTQTPTVANNIFTLTGVIINSGGATTIACS